MDSRGLVKVASAALLLVYVTVNAGAYDGTRQAMREGCDKECMEQRIANVKEENGLTAKIMFGESSAGRNLAYIFH